MSEEEKTERLKVLSELCQVIITAYDDLLIDERGARNHLSLFLGAVQATIGS